MRLSPAQKSILSVTACALIALVIIGAVIFPTISQMSKISNDTEELKSYLEKKYLDVMSIRPSLKKLPEVKADVAHYSDHFFYQSDNLKLITTLENLADRRQVTQQIESSNLDQNNLSWVRLNLNLSGKYDDILNYLNDLESSPYFINLESLQISPVFDRLGAGDNIIMRLSISLYVNK